jgi:hypothetical protein
MWIAIAIAFVLGFLAFPVACMGVIATFDENLME